jgi:hypothetical protein
VWLRSESSVPNIVDEQTNCDEGGSGAYTNQAPDGYADGLHHSAGGTVGTDNRIKEKPASAGFKMGATGP